MDTTPSILPVPSGHAAYDEATATYNLLAEISPARTVIARNAAEVQDAILYARNEGLHVSMISTGHSAHTSQPLNDALLIRTDFDESVDIDPQARTATIAAGTRWSTVAHAAAAHSLAVLHGSSGDVGVVGYLLRGGISFYGREHGVAANSVLSITLVRADGNVVTTSADEDPDLFWAIRGGGGGFGVVTAITVALFPMWRVFTGITFWDATRAVELASTWREWTRTAPRELSTSFRVLNLPPLPGIPAAIAGRTVVAVDGAASVASESDLSSREDMVDALLSPLRAIAAPLLDTWALHAPEALLLTHMDPPEPLPFVGDHELLAGVTDDDLERLLSLVGEGSESTLTIVELRQLGGAFAEASLTGGAFQQTDADFALLQIGAVGGPITAERQRETMARVRQALAHLDTGFTLPSFLESRTQPSRTFDDESRTIVDRVRRRVDPDGLFAPSVVPFVIS